MKSWSTKISSIRRDMEDVLADDSQPIASLDQLKFRQQRRRTLSAQFVEYAEEMERGLSDWSLHDARQQDH